MSKVHITTGSNKTTQYDEEQVRTMIVQGELPSDSLFWREGMSGWQPISSFPNKSVMLTHSPSTQSQSTAHLNFAFTKDPSRLTKILKILLWVYLAVVIAFLASNIAQLNLINRPEVSTEAAEANEDRQAFIGALLMGVYLCTAIPFLMWIYRANRNCRGFCAAHMKFTPGWSIGFYFIPLLNLVKPYQAMKEIWMVSEDPVNWGMKKGSALLRWWWILWLTSNFTSQLAMRLSSSDLATATVF